MSNPPDADGVDARVGWVVGRVDDVLFSLQLE